ncbi:MAG: DUF1501 domain-containing protein [Acidobacteria bacterium]|nr:DUF1501 domain-containing protein [Acidobacteriota bacterium]
MSTSAKDRFGFDWTRIPGQKFWRAPHLNRRVIFRHMAAGVGGYFLLPQRPGERIAHAAATTKATADSCIFVMMNGGPSHIDTFDLKVGPWLPANYQATTMDGVSWAPGLLPKLTEQFDNIALMRSVKPWNTAHGLAQTWLQIGRNPISGLARIAPHIGSVVSLELGPKSADQTLPGFLSLNAGGGPGQGYLSPEHAPFYVSPGGGGLGNTNHFDPQATFERRYNLLMDLDAETRAAQAPSAAAAETARWNDSARRLMYNAEVNRIFTFDAAERLRYGNTGFGNACITARNLLKAKKGTRFIQITAGGWDMHANIYGGGLNAGNVNSVGRQFDSALGTLLADLKADGLLDRTLVLAMGEFGRTLGTPNAQAGRDHFMQQAALVAGAGVRGRRAIGSTDERGANTAEPGWYRDRDIRAEDIEATIYSALGIDWTTIRRDDPTGRGFEYVPFADRDLYGPVHELWG